MAEACIPVDLFNPGQVFACLGFLEVADLLSGGAEGGFDCSDPAETRFVFRADGKTNPVEAVLCFLAEAEVVILVPYGAEGPWPSDAEFKRTFPAPLKSLRKSSGSALTASSLPIRLEKGSTSLYVSSWLKADSREPFKLFAGQQAGAQLATNMLSGDSKKNGTMGIRNLYEAIKENCFEDPFSFTCAVGGRFGFDARGAWDALRIGTSLDEQGIVVDASPLVEMLAAIGLEHARPHFLSTYQIRYSVWDVVLPLLLCRAAFSDSGELLPSRNLKKFRAHLGDDQQYKKIFPAQLET